MFTNALFDHQYDIDDLIIAFCASEKKGRFILNSRSGEIFYEAPHHIKNSPFKDKDDENHIHVITPLNERILHTLSTHTSLNQLTSEKREKTLAFLAKCTKVSDLPSSFSEPYGGWVREQIKTLCLTWLDQRHMIPPSMQHTYKCSVNMEKNTPKKVTIISDE